MQASTLHRTAVVIRQALGTDIPRLVEMAVRFLELTPYGALVAPAPEAIARLIGNVFRLGAVLVAEEPAGPHEWRVQRLGGHPADAESSELTTVCRRCGLENQAGDESMSVCDSYVVGMLALVILPHPISGEVYADEIAWWVEPEFRARTIGPRLLREAELFARSRGVRVIKMLAPATPEGELVGRFYQHRGYVRVETVYQKTLEPLERQEV